MAAILKIFKIRFRYFSSNFDVVNHALKSWDGFSKHHVYLTKAAPSCTATCSSNCIHKYLKRQISEKIILILVYFRLSLEINFLLANFLIECSRTAKLDTDLKEKLNIVSLLEFYINFILPRKNINKY